MNTAAEHIAGQRMTPRLTFRQRDCLRLAAAGLTVPQISARTGLARGTVRNYLRHARTELGAATIAHACALAVIHGIVTADHLKEPS